MAAPAHHLVRSNAGDRSSAPAPVLYAAVLRHKTDSVSDIFENLMAELQFLVEHGLLGMQYLLNKEMKKAL
jgi:hypothetical protein